MDKWERLKGQVQNRTEQAKMSFETAKPYSATKAMFLQEFTDYKDIMDYMIHLEKSHGREDFNHRFLKFLSKGIGAKEWETTLQRTIKKYPDGADFWEGYTTALIQIKVYYEKLMNPSKDN